MARKISVTILGDASSLERSFGRGSRAARNFDRNLGRSTRGVLAATLSIRGLSRAFAFSSVGFLGGTGVGFAFKSTIQAAEESQRVLAQTRNAVERSGQSWQQYGRQIREAALAQADLSGFNDESLLQSFAVFERRTGNVNTALRLNALAANVARGRSIALAAGQQIVVKASIGMAGQLRRLGLNVGKHASSLKLLAFLNEKYGKSAAAFGKTAPGAQDRFRNSLENVQEAIGSKALPSLTKYLNEATRWLNQSKNQARVERDVAQAITGTTEVVRDVTKGFKIAAGAVGGFKHLIEGLIALKVASTVSGWATSILAFRTALAASALANTEVAAGTAAADAKLLVLGTTTAKFSEGAKVAAARTGLLKNSLLALGRLGPLAIAAAVTELIVNRKAIDKSVSSFLRGHHLGAFTGGNELTTINGLKDEIALRKKIGAETFLQERLLKQVATAQAKIPPLIRRSPDTIDAADAARRNSGSFFLPKVKPPGVSASLRNQFFDDALSRSLNRVQDITQPRAALARLAQLSALISAQINRVKDITRKLTLRDRLLEVQRQAKALREQIAADFMDGLQLGLEKAQVTANFTDDLAALGRIRAALQRQIAAEGKTVELDRQLFQARQQSNEARLAQRNARQFRALGLDATGNELAPTAKALRAELNSVSGALKGTFLDTSATQSLLRGIRRVMSSQLGALSSEVRSKMKELLDNLKAQLNEFDGFNLRAADRRRRFLDRQTARKDRLRPAPSGGKGSGNTTINATVHADGATPENVMRGLDRWAFRYQAANP